MTGRQTVSTFNYIVSRWRNITLFLMLFFSANYTWAQKEDDATDDEISILLEVKGIGNADITAIIRDNDVYLPLNTVFDFLKIKNVPSSSYDSLLGFYVVQNDVFLIDKAHNRITFRDTVTNLKPGELLKAENNLYLRLKYFKTVFGLDGVFNFRRLAVTLSSNVELPAIRDAKQEQMRKNISRLRGEIKADTVIKRTYPAFNLGAADWAVMSTQQSLGVDETRFNLGLGAILAGGEANASLNYYTRSLVDEKQQYYQWRFVNNDNPLLRQVIAGKIYAQSISTLYAPVVGVQFTNASTIYRKSYGTYTLSNTTDPGWIVELYVNGVLVDYKKTDASGFYTFEVPLIYGYSIIKLRFYGPYGEERTSQQYINIPFNFIPVREFEYTASAGIVEDGRNSLFSRGSVNYGISSYLTIGGGIEYLSSVTSGTTMPFICTSIKLAPRLLLSGEYDYGVRGRGVLSYRLPTNLQIDLDYTKYAAGQTAIYYNYLEERKAMFSMPIHSYWMSLFSRLTLDQIVVPNTKYTNAELTFAGTVQKVGVNFSNYASFVHATSPYLYGLFSLSFTLPKKIIFTSQVQYDYKLNEAVFMKYTFEKRFFASGFINASYQEFFNNNGIENVAGNYRNILIGLRYDFSAARVAVSALQDNNKGYSRIESASGSFIFDRKTDYVNANNRTNVGKGEIAIEPFLDINCNGIHDPGEPRVPGLKLQMNGGRTIYDEKDTIVRILDLEPYVTYYVDLDKSSFDNIAWQIRNHLISVTVSPNDFTLVEVPVSVVGEVSGMVTVNDKNGIGQKGERQILINIYDTVQRMVARTISESDGYFSYIGLAPGNYNLQIDSAQLQKLHLKPSKTSIPVHIAVNKDGDIADGLEFKLQPDTTKSRNVVNAVNGLAVIDSSNKPGTTDQNTSNTVVDSVVAVHNRKIVVKPIPDDYKLKEITGKNNSGGTAGNSQRKNRIDSMQAIGKYHPDGLSFIELTSQIYKFYSGTVVCVMNDSSDYLDIVQVNSRGEFLLYDFLYFKVTVPDTASGILSQAIFVNPEMQVIESVNTRLVNGRYIYSTNSKEPRAIRAKVRIFADKENATLLHTIYFDEEDAGLLPAGISGLDQVVDYMNKNPKTRIYLAGHADAWEITDNRLLSRNRANAAINYLISKGIKRNRITSKKSWVVSSINPTRLAPTPDENRRNRRLDIYIKEN